MSKSVSTGTERTVRLILVDGAPNGVIAAEIGNWSGKAFSAPRARLPDLIRRPEADRTGVYILVGRDPERAIGQRAYIGETDSIRNRLRLHLEAEDMEFFERAVFVVSKDENLTKAHARFLESELIQRAREVGEVSLANGTHPRFSRLPEADLFDMKLFLDQVHTVLPILGFDLFRRVSSQNLKDASASAESPIFEIDVAGAQATAREADGAFIVLAGSTARKDGTPTFPDGYLQLRDQLLKDKKLENGSESGFYRFVSEVAFGSPSAAASVVAARSASGPREWHVRGTGQTYKEWREAQLAD